MKIFWFLLYIAAAFYWFCLACEFVERSWMMATFAFIFTGVNMLISSFKELTE